MKNSTPFRGIIFALFCVSAVSGLKAQVKVGDNPTVKNTDAMLEVESANKGFLLPRVALTATDKAAPLSAHVKGMTVYNTATTTTGVNDVTPGYYYNDGTQWVRLTTGGITSITNTNTLTQSGGLMTTVNGQTATTAIASGTAAQVLGFDAAGNPVYQSASSLSPATTNVLANDGTNTLTSTVNGNVKAASIVNSVVNNLSGSNLTTTVNGVGSTALDLTPLITTATTNTNALTQSGGLKTTVNGVTATTAINSGNVSQIVGFDASGNPIRQSQWFYMPSIPISTSTIATGQTKDLYNLYTTQFSAPAASSPGAPASIPYIPAATSLYYYVTSYDNTVFANVSISASGVMTYDVISNATPASYINIVLLVK